MGENRFENYEFAFLNDNLAFDLLSLDLPDNYPLWNIPELFKAHRNDFLMGKEVNEENPNLVVLRLG